MSEHSSNRTNHHINKNEKFINRLARWGRQLLFIPIFHKKWLNTESKNTLNQQISASEQGHRGEIVLIIENHLPIRSAFYQNCHDRAIELFAQYHVWDTEENTGVLVYVNLCEKQLEIIADRGIHRHVGQAVWQVLCDKAINQIKQDQPIQAISELLDEIGQLLRKFYQNPDKEMEQKTDPFGNELPDPLIHLK